MTVITFVKYQKIMIFHNSVIINSQKYDHENISMELDYFFDKKFTYFFLIKNATLLDN